MAYGSNVKIGEDIENNNIENATALGVGARIKRSWASTTEIADKLTADEVIEKSKDKTFMHTGNNTMALGNNSVASLENSVALGYGSVTDYTYQDLQHPGWTAKGSLAVPTSGRTGVISVGEKGKERRIVNVASGWLDTDAVNVVQLRTLEEKVDNRVDNIESGMHYLSVNKLGDNFGTEKGSRAITELIERRKTYDLYIRYKAQALQLEAREKWLGEKFDPTSKQAIKDKVIEIENADTTGVIKNAAENLRNITVGNLSATDKPADKYKELVEKIDTAKAEITTPAAYRSLVDGEDIDALKRETNYSNEGAKGKDSLAIGFRAVTNDKSDYAVALGFKAIAYGENSLALGARARATRKNTVALGENSKADLENSVAIGQGTSATESKGNSYATNRVFKDTGRVVAFGTRRLTGVEDGANDDEAVTVRQLKATLPTIKAQYLPGGVNDFPKLDPGATITIKGGDFNTSTTDSEQFYSGNNLATHINGNSKTPEITIGLKKIPTFKSLKLNNENTGAQSLSLTVDNSGNLDLGNKKITGLADGTISDSSTDAVNGKQLNTVKTTADTAKSTADTVAGKITALEGKKLGFTGNSGTKVEKKLGEDIAIKGDDSSITTEAGNNAITIKVKDKGITSAKIADKAVGTTQLGDKVVTTYKIADKNITEDKLAEGLLTKINAGNTVATNTITLSGDNGADSNPTKTSAVALNKNGGIEFSITGKDGLKTTASGSKVEIGMTDDLKNKIAKLDNLADNAGNTYATKSELDNKANKNLDNIDNTGINKIKDTAKEAITVSAGTKISVNESTDTTTHKTTYTVSLDNDTVSTLNNIGKISDGKDGKNGTAGTAGGTAPAGNHGLTGQDGLNGKDLTNKVNALRNGEAGTVVFTNKAGDRLVKANDGKYYKSSQVGTDGEVITSTGGQKPSPVATADIELRVVDSTGTTTTNIKLSNIADGKIDANSKEAINGSQIKTMLDKLGVKIDDTTGAIKDPDVNKVEGDTNKPTSVVEGLNKVIDKVNSGITFGGDTGKEKQLLGSTLEVKSGDITETVGDKTVKYLAKNLKTKYAKDTAGNGTISVGFTDDPVFNSVTTKELIFENATGKKLTLGPTDDGNNLKIGDKEVATKQDVILKLTTDGTAENGSVDLSSQKLQVTGGSDKVSVAIANQKITVDLSETVKAKIDNVGKKSDGRDGKNATTNAGSNGTHGLTGKDGLNGKDLTDKVNALRNGEAGTVIYTNENGERVYKANDGKYYKKDDIEDDGNAKAGKTGLENPELRLVNANGMATTAVKLRNIADGDVSANSTDAINGKQFHTLSTNTIKLTADGVTESGVKKDDTTEAKSLNTSGGISFGIKGADGIETTAKGTDVTVKLKGEYKTKLDNLDTNANDKYANKDATGLSEDNKEKWKEALGIRNVVTGNGTLSIETATLGTATGATEETKGTAKVKLDGTEKFKMTGTDGIIVSANDKTITLGLSDETKAKIDNVGKKSDGRDGKDGTTAGSNGANGLTGKDGLNGKDLTDKVNALRNGEAGTVIYTNEAGERVYKANDGKYYKKDDIETNGDAKAGKTGLDNPELRVVNANGEATKATILNNLANGIKDLTNGTTAISAANAKTAVSTLLTQTEGLNKAVNVGDLQALAQAGLEFGANTGTATHQALGTTLNIKGKSDANYDDTYTSDNVATKVTEGNIEIGFKKSPTFTKVTADEVETGKAKIKDELTFDKGDGNTTTIVAGDGKGALLINGKKVATSISAPVLYTDENGAVVEKGLDDKIYKTADLNGKRFDPTTKKYYEESQFTNGKLNTGATPATLTEVDATKVKHALATIDNNSVSTPKVLSNVATGVADTDAVNTKQLKDSYITFGGDNTTDKANQLLGSTLEVKSGDFTTGTGTTAVEYKGENLSTKYTKDTTTGNGVITVGLKENVSFKKVEATEGVTTPKVSTDALEIKKDGTTDKATVKVDKDGNIDVDGKKIFTGDVVLKTSTEKNGTETEGSVNITKSNKLTINSQDGVTVTLAENKFTIGLDADTKAKIENVGKKSDGIDGKDGTTTGSNGANGLTGKDGLNGKDLTDKVNALRNGEAGTVIYTNEAGERVYKANDGKYYKKDEIGTSGDALAGKIGIENPELRVVNAKGSTTDAVKLNNVADGKIDATSKEAINGSQIKSVLDKLGVKINNGNIEAPTITTLKGADGKDGETKTTLVDGLNEVISRVNSGIKYNADLGTEGTQQLGSVLNVNKATNTLTKTEGTNNINYVGDNLITKYTKNDTDGSGKLEIGFKESPTFKDLTATNGNFTNLKVTEKIVTKEIEFKDAVGNSLTLVTGQDGNLYINGVSVPTAASAPVLYTNKNGERVELAQDGNVYKPEDIKNLTYVKANGTQAAGFYAEDQFEKDTEGHIKRDENGNKILKPGATSTDVSSKVYSDEVVHRLSPIKKDKTTPNKLTNLAEGDVSATSTDAINGKQFHSLSTNTIKLTADGVTESGVKKDDATEAKSLNTSGGISFGIKGADGIETTAKGTDVTVKLKEAYKNKLENLADDANTKYAHKDASNLTELTNAEKAKWREAIGLENAVSGTGTLSIDAFTTKGTTEESKGTSKVKLDGTENFKLVGKDGITVESDSDKKLTFGLDQATKDKLSNITKVSDGKDGKNGTDGTTTAGSHGLTGKDGLNGKDLTAKVNALRNGEAGTVVFTNEAGERLIKGNDGKYYKPDQLEENGDVKATATGQGVDNPELRVVNANGETTKATTLNNLANGLAGITRDAGKPISEATAKTVVATLLAQTTGLDKAVNVGDLQALAQAGLEFGANTGTATHRALGTTLNIKGKDGVTYNDDYTSDNVATKVTEGNIEIGFKKSPTFTKVTADEVETGKAKIKEELTFDKGDGKPTTIVAGDGNGSLLVNGKKVATSDSAPVLYTDDQGNIVEKGLDNKIYKTADLNGKRFDKDSGKYYNEDQFDNTGKLIAGATEATLTPVNADKVIHALASLTDGSVTHAKVLDKVADGKISATSKEAINGSQIKTVLDKMGVELDTNGNIKAPEITPIKDSKDTAQTAPTTIVKGLNDVISTLNSGITFGGDNTKEKQLLGSTLEVKTGEFETGTGTSKVKYVGTNIKTSYTKDTTTGNGVINIGITENPTFTTVNATDKVITNTVETKEISLVDKTDNTKKANIVYDDSKVKINGKEVATKEALDTVTSNNFKLTGDTGSTDNQALNKAGGLSFGIKGSDTIETIASKTDVTIKLKDAYKTKLDNLDVNANDKYATKDLDNMTATAKAKVKDLAVEAVTVTAGTGIQVTGTAGTNSKSYEVKLDDETQAKLNNISAKSDGRDGKEGKDGQDSNATHGLTGKDGLNGKDLTDKVNALRNGEAGTVIFTNEAGERLIKGNDGKYYKPDQLDDKGNVKADAQGQGVENPELRLVNANGETTKATTLNNLANALSNRDAGTAITAEKAKGVVETLLTKTNGLDKAVNLADLQAIAQAGLDFSGNTGVATLHRALGTKLQIVGEGTPAADFVGASDNINVKAIEDATNKISKLEIQLAKALKNIESIQNGDTKITLDKDKGVAINGKDGGTIVVKGKDGKDGVSIKGGDGTNAPTIAFDKTDDNKGTGTITGLKDPETNTDGTPKDPTAATTVNYVTNKIEGAKTEITNKITNIVDGGMKYTGNDNVEVTVKLNKGLNIKGEGTYDGKDSASGNIAVIGNNTTSTLEIKLNKNLNNIETISNGKSKITIGENGISISGKDGKDAVAINGTDGTNGASIVVKGKDGKDGISIKGGDGTNAPTIAFDKTDDNKGTGTITGLKDPELNNDGTPKDPTAATTVNYVNNYVTNKINSVTEKMDKGLNFVGNDGNKVNAKLDETVSITGEGTVPTGTNTAANNIKVEKDTTTGKTGLVVKLADKLTGMTGFETKEEDGKKVTINKDGITFNKDADGKGTGVITGLKDSTDATSAVTYGTYNTFKTEVNNKLDKVSKIKYVGDNKEENTVAPDTGFNFKGDGNIVTEAKKDGEITFNLKKDINLGSTGGQTGTITGVRTIENDSSSVATVDYVEKKVSATNQIATEALSGVANAVAMANLVQASSFNDYRHQLSAAYGYYGSQHALAIGFSGITQNRRLVYRLSGSVNNGGHLAFGAGVGLMLGEKMTEKNESNYPQTLFERLEALEKENKLIKGDNERLSKLEAENKAIRQENQEIKELLKKILKNNK